MTLTGYSLENSTLRQRILSIWAGDPETTIAWEGREFKKPANVAWIRPAIHGVDVREASLNNGHGLLYRHTGLVLIELFSPFGVGDGAALLLADELADGMRGFSITGLRVYAPKIVKVGRSKSWFKVNIEAPFQRDTAY